MMTRRPLDTAALAAILLLCSGCATQMLFPATRFNGPDTRGWGPEPPAPSKTTSEVADDKDKDASSGPWSGKLPAWEPPSVVGHVMPVAIGGGEAAIPFPATGGDFDYGPAVAGYGLGADVPLRDDLDLGLRIQPNAPLIVRGKYQVAGTPQSRPLPWDFVGSFIVSAGLGMSAATVTDGTSEATLSMSALSFDASFCGGVRPTQSGTLLVYLEPFFRLNNLSADITYESGGADKTASGSGTEFGAALGARFEWDQLFLMTELVWTRGTFEGIDGVGFFPGLAIGFTL